MTNERLTNKIYEWPLSSSPFAIQQHWSAGGEKLRGAPIETININISYKLNKEKKIQKTSYIAILDFINYF